ncbi:hypothetical protein [uncultured Croceitalea sp.]|uniref:hypothetical protein n=1 Tax=uncultured Croceitalea sp. TaxID=1798908 RepID=UPI003305CA9C
MNQETLILQASPRIEILFFQNELEVKKAGTVVVERTKYAQIKSVSFDKGQIPWITGLVTAIIDLATGHGIGQWKRERGKLELATDYSSHTIEFVNYDREQTPRAVQMINEKLT